jgi:hypothetical protein
MQPQNTLVRVSSHALFVAISSLKTSSDRLTHLVRRFMGIVSVSTEMDANLDLVCRQIGRWS